VVGRHGHGRWSNRLDRTELDALLANAGAVIDAMRGSFAVKCTTIAVTATRSDVSWTWLMHVHAGTQTTPDQLP
jgi:hypothetical protein